MWFGAYKVEDGVDVHTVESFKLRGVSSGIACEESLWKTLASGDEKLLPSI